MSGAKGTGVMAGTPPRVADDGHHCTVARTYLHTDPTNASDRLRIRDARSVVRASLRQTPRGNVDAVRAIFREEIGTNVRSVSPFLLSLVASQDATIDGLVERIRPAPRWPRSPALSARPAIEFRRDREPYQRFVVSTAAGDRDAIRLRGFGHGMLFMQSHDDWAWIEVIDHSLEVEARIGPARLETLFGVLRIELDVALPNTVAAALVGRPICDVVDHASLRAWQWPIVSIEEPPSTTLGPTLVVQSGSVAFRMPWMR